MRPRLAILLLSVAFLGALGWVGRATQRHRAKSAEQAKQLVVTTTAKRHDLLLTITQTGVIAAKSTTPVIPEISGRLQWVCENGILVKAGDQILRLDPTKMQEDLDALIVRYDAASRRQATAESVGKARMEEMRLRLKQAEDAVTSFERQQEIALRQKADKLKFDAADLDRRREDVETKRRLAAKGLIPGSELDRESASLKAAEFALQRAQTDYELEKSKVAADTLERRRNVNNTTRDMSRTRSWSERETRMSGNEVENLKLQLDRAKEDMKKTVLTASVGGLVVLSAQGGWRGNSQLPRLGDWVSQGREVASVISLDHMQVKLELDQKQIAGVKMGQSAEVTIEALPGKTLQGKITSIGQTARRPPVQGWMGMSATTSFPVTLDLAPAGKVLLRPGMRATVRLVSQRIKNAILVPSGCIFTRDGHSLVYAERQGRFVPVAVTTGASDGDYTAITKGLQEGERLALNDLGAPAEQEPGAKPKEPRP